MKPILSVYGAFDISIIPLDKVKLEIDDKEVLS
jgi:hypothetical protein